MVKKGKNSPIFCFVCLFVCLFVFFCIVPLICICVTLERPSWSYGARVGRASKDKFDQASIPFHPFLRRVYPLLAINSLKNSKWGRRIIIQRKNLQHPHLLLLFQQQIYLLNLVLAPSHTAWLTVHIKTVFSVSENGESFSKTLFSKGNQISDTVPF